MMPHVIHIPRRFTATAWGGTERVLTETIRRQRALGWDARVMTSMAMASLAHEDINDIPVQRFPYIYPLWPLSAPRRAAFDRKGGNLVSFALARALAQAPALDLVHLHTGNRLGAQVLRVARRRGVPVVVSLHGGHFDIPTSERSDLTARHLGASCEWGRILSWWWGTRTLLQRVDAVVCVGHEEYRRACAALPNQRVVFIPGAVDPLPFAAGNAQRGRQLLGLATPSPTIVCLARIDHQKDQLTLVRAWRALQHPEPVNVVLVGAETSPDYTQQLRAAAAGAAGQFICTGNVAPDQVPDVLAAADVVALPSRHEPFGLAVIEAWASARAVVAARTGGPQWLLAEDGPCHGAGGLSFPPGDVAACCAALSAMLRDPERARTFGLAGRAAVLRQFTWEHHLRALHAVYRSVNPAFQEHA